MKVFYILNSFIPEKIGGTEIYVYELAKQLLANNHDIKIIKPNYGKKINSLISYDGISVYSYEEPSTVDRELVMGFKTPIGLNYFTQYLKKENPEIIHFHELNGSNGITIHHVKEAKRLGKKVLITLHLSSYSCMNGTLIHNGQSLCNGKIDLRSCTKCYLKSKTTNPFHNYFLSETSLLLSRLGLNFTRLLNRLGTALGTAALVKKKQQDLIELVSYCDNVVVLNNWYMDILIANGISPAKIVMIPQGLPSHVPPKQIHRRNSGIIKFLFIGRISQFKGVHLLINAFKELEPNRAELHIYGQADDLDYEQSLRQSSDSIANIHWNGILAHSDVVHTMLDYDALCLCSTFSEMSPLVIQEAFSAGLPVIASNVYGNAEQIKHEVNGLLFDFNDIDDLKKQLNRCIYDSRILQQLKEGISPPRSFLEVASEYMGIYSQLIKE